MTLHHLKHRAEGGKTSVENGAIVNEMAHRYLHDGLTREQEEIANMMLIEYKQKHYKKCHIEILPEVDELQEINIKMAEMSFSFERGLEINISEEEYKEHKRKRNERVNRRFENDRII